MDDGFIELEQDHRAIEEDFQSFLRDNEEPVVRPARPVVTDAAGALPPGPVQFKVYM